MARSLLASTVGSALRPGQGTEIAANRHACTNGPLSNTARDVVLASPSSSRTLRTMFAPPVRLCSSARGILTCFGACLPPAVTTRKSDCIPPLGLLRQTPTYRML